MRARTHARNIADRLEGIPCVHHDLDDDDASTGFVRLGDDVLARGPPSPRQVGLTFDPNAKTLARERLVIDTKHSMRFTGHHCCGLSYLNFE
jgi:hypothetical protein